MALKKITAKTIEGSLDTHIGDSNDLFFDANNPTALFLSDGSTVGGVPMSGGSGITPVTFTFTGTFNSAIKYQSVVPQLVTSLPSGETYTANGPWLAGIYIDEQDITTVSGNMVGALQDINISYNDLLTEISFPNLKIAVQELYFPNNDILELVDLPEIEYIGDTFNVGSGIPGIVINTPKVKFINDIYFTDLDNPIYDFPELVEADEVQFNNIENMPTVDLPVLANIYDRLSVTYCPNTVNILVPELTSVRYIYVEYCPLVTSLSFPKLESVRELNLSNCDSLETVSFPVLKKVTGYVNMYSATSLLPATIDYILELLASLDGTNGTTLFENQSVNISGGNLPTSAGLAAQVILEGRGCTISIS